MVVDPCDHQNGTSFYADQGYQKLTRVGVPHACLTGRDWLIAVSCFGRHVGLPRGAQPASDTGQRDETLDLVAARLGISGRKPLRPYEVRTGLAHPNAMSSRIDVRE